MADSYLVQIDLAKMAENLTKAENQPHTEVEALALLVDNGFHRQTRLGPDWFLCEEISLGFLGKDEIKDKRLHA